MRYIFFLFFIACTSISENNTQMQQDVQGVVVLFCENQTKQIELADLMKKYQQENKLPDEAVDKMMEEINKKTEAYALALDQLMKKYEGQERAVHSLLKKGQLNCK